MRKISVLALIISLLIIVPISVYAGTRYVDDDSPCDGNTPCYAHPQDAVNAADPGDTILVYPGTYDTRNFPCPWTSCSCSDDNAPALIVYKDNLTIEAVDPDPTKTVIQSTHDCWSNPIAVKASTDDAISSTASPNGVIIIADNVIIEGFTIYSTYGGDPNAPTQYPNTGGVFIGGLYGGDMNHIGVTGTNLLNCIISGHSGVRIWKATDTVIDGNVIDNNRHGDPIVAPGTTPAQATIEVWDGWDQGSESSIGLQILNNTLDSFDGQPSVALGGYLSSSIGNLIDQSNLFIHGNTVSSTGHGVQFYFSGGTGKFITCVNTIVVPEGFDQVAIIGGSTYDGPFGINCDDQFVTGGGWIDSPVGAYREPVMHYYPDQVLENWQGGNFEDVWDLTKGDLTLSFTLDMSGIQNPGWSLVETGLRELGQPNIDPYGGWLLSKYASDANNNNLAELNDYHVLVTSPYPYDEHYDVLSPDTLVTPMLVYDYNNHGFWFDRDGVDPDQANYWNYIDGVTYNTNGIYDIEITYHALNINTATMFVNINGAQQGLYRLGYQSSGPPDTYPVGRSFAGDMTQMKVFFGRGGGDGTVALSNISLGYPDLTGKANFAFISKYKKGATVPTGQTVFIFKAGDLNFHSDSYDWLVVTGSNYARFKGLGTINGEGDYKFMLWASDGEPDTFRIKIWEEDEYENEIVIYDNGLNQAIGGGSIVIHTKKE